MSWREIIDVAPWRSMPGSGISVEGWFDEIDGDVVLLNANGDAVDSGEWCRKLKPGDDKREVARKLLRAWHVRPRPKGNLLTGPVRVPPHGGY